MNFLNNSTAGTGEIIAGLVSDPTGFQAGFIKFFNNSTAGSATISALDGSNIEFHDFSALQLRRSFRPPAETFY